MAASTAGYTTSAALTTLAPIEGRSPSERVRSSDGHCAASVTAVTSTATVTARRAGAADATVASITTEASERSSDGTTRRLSVISRLGIGKAASSTAASAASSCSNTIRRRTSLTRLSRLPVLAIVRNRKHVLVVLTHLPGALPAPSEGSRRPSIGTRLGLPGGPGPTIGTGCIGLITLAGETGSAPRRRLRER